MLTIGFARRVATYKRLDLMLRDVDRALALLADTRASRAAHPRRQGPPARRRRQAPGPAPVRDEGPRGGRPPRRSILDDYDHALAAAMVRGCDVWVNVPRPPLEASGTSGMKSAVNGGLQLGVLDGWWPEAYDGTNGWAIGGEVDHDHGGAGLAPRRGALPAAERRGRPHLLRPRRRRPPAGVARDGAIVAAHDRPALQRGTHGPRLRGADLPGLARGGVRAGPPA